MNQDIACSLISSLKKPYFESYPSINGMSLVWNVMISTIVNSVLSTSSDWTHFLAQKKIGDKPFDEEVKRQCQWVDMSVAVLGAAGTIFFLIRFVEAAAAVAFGVLACQIGGVWLAVGVVTYMNANRYDKALQNHPLAGPFLKQAEHFTS